MNIKNKLFNLIFISFLIVSSALADDKKEKEDLLNTENKLLEVETNSSKELLSSKSQLNQLQNELDLMLDQIVLHLLPGVE